MESKVVLTFQEYADVGKKPSASEWKDLQKLIEANLPAFGKICLCLKAF